MAGVPGFEPGMAIPKTAALPLGYTPLPIGRGENTQGFAKTQVPKTMFFTLHEYLPVSTKVY
tara:strand:- start:325 stop:510 length:186 start_codon:yes stop_codon:yes gene_type:complete